jgi:hypothetical protein
MNKGCDTRRPTVQHTKDRIGDFLKKMFMSGEDSLIFLSREI